MPSSVRFRWAAMAAVTLSSVLNYLDRQLLAAQAPALRAELGLSNTDYGWLLAAFSIAYALSALPAGWLIDRLGLGRGLCLVVAVWSVAGLGTGLAAGLVPLLLMRALLGAAQAGGVPGTSKATAAYLPPQERALGSATTQFGLSVGALLAPLMAAWFSTHSGWRASFVFTGALGFAWIPLWLYVTRRIRPVPDKPLTRPATSREILSDSRLWGLVAATALFMTLYSLWSNWTTVYLVEERGLTAAAANSTLAWIPPLFANLGGFAGGWLALWLIRRGGDVLASRLRVCWWSAAILLATAAIPLAPGPGTATALICLSFYWVTAMSVNVYAIPMDLFGADRAALAVSALTCAYGVMQTLVSPAIGALIDRYGFAAVCAGFAVLPLAGAAVLQATQPRR